MNIILHVAIQRVHHSALALITYVHIYLFNHLYLCCVPALYGHADTCRGTRAAVN